MLINEANRKNELIEEAQQTRANSGGRGSRNTRISGDQLKAKLQSGQIPNDELGVFFIYRIFIY